jgi:hypothetical protein
MAQTTLPHQNSFMQNASMPGASGKLLLSIPLAGLVLLLMMFTAAAQPAPLLYVETIQMVPGGPLQMTFRDEGTGATNYVAEFAGALGSGEGWTMDPGAVITSLGGGEYRVDVADPLEPNGFYRVVALTPSGPIVAQFANTSLQVNEGETVEAVIQFSAPFTGTLNYRVEGPASGYVGPLSGSVTVNNATTAKIVLQIGDNLTADELSFLSLIIDAGGALLVGPDSQALITIHDNDAVWDGGFVGDGLEFAFKYRRTLNGGVRQAALISDGTGLIPAGEYPAQLGAPGQPFPAIVVISLPASASALGLASTLSLLLDVQPGVGDDLLTEDEVQGTATVTSGYAGKEHLNSTRSGRFILQRPPPAPSTSEVELVNNP